MFGDRNRNVQSNQKSSHRDKSKTAMGIVYKVILDVDDDILKDLEIPEGIRTKYIGAIQFRLNDSANKKDEALSLALPYDKTNVSLPTINETVRVINPEGGGFTYQRIISSPTPNINTGTGEITAAQRKEKAASTSSAKEYNKVQSTGITKTSNSGDNSDLEKYGNYFEPQLEIHKLKLYEGDNLIESRFGQSIRFSGYNNGDNIFSPSIIIRNGENGESLSSGVGNSTEEDINKDGGIICLSSGDRLLNYILPIQNTKESFINYPNELKGNQILLNSDRLIFSARTAEMIFASKKDTGFITDGQFSIDATGGINVTTDSSIFVDTKDRDFNIDVGDGTIFLGTDGELEAAPKGETLVELLGELIDLIAQQIYLTPSGPTKAGPTNVAEFSALKSKLNSILSNNVQLK
jgi:hypothetical protein